MGTVADDDRPSIAVRVDPCDHRHGDHGQHAAGAGDPRHPRRVRRLGLRRRAADRRDVVPRHLHGAGDRCARRSARTATGARAVPRDVRCVRHCRRARPVVRLAHRRTSRHGHRRSRVDQPRRGADRRPLGPRRPHPPDRTQRCVPHGVPRRDAPDRWGAHRPRLVAAGARALQPRRRDRVRRVADAAARPARLDGVDARAARRRRRGDPTSGRAGDPDRWRRLVRDDLRCLPVDAADPPRERVRLRRIGARAVPRAPGHSRRRWWRSTCSGCATGCRPERCS